MTLELLSPSSISVTDGGDKGASTATVFDLNTLLGNHNGSFDSAGVWFAASARNVTLRGRVLCAELRDLDQNWRYDEISILPWKSPPTADGTYQISFDKSEIGIEQGWSDDLPFTVLTASSLDDCRHVRLRPKSTVVALCRIALKDDPDVHGEYRKRSIDLNRFLGNRNGHFDEDGEEFADTARNVRIDGTKLVADLRTVSKEWREDSIDLARLIVCKNGRLQAARAGKEAVRAGKEADNATEAPQRSTEDLKMLVKTVSGASARLYTPLNNSENAFRLCYVLPGAWHDRLECYMVTEAMGSLQYRCLSYCWGDPGATEFVSINGHCVPVRQNLAHALRRLRARNMHSAVWIDAICINQEDNTEKSHQVSRMANIFSGASETLIWLGGDHTTALMGSRDTTSELDSSDILIDALDDFDNYRVWSIWQFTSIIIRADGTMGYGGYADRLVSAVERFLDSEWFTRAWTIQELMLTDHATMLYGRRAIRWKTLQNVHSFIDHCFRNGLAALAASEEEDNSTSGAHIKPLSFAFRQLVVRLWRFRKMQKDYDQTRSRESDDGTHRRDTALLLLQKCRSQKSTDPRDKLFAFYTVAKATFGNLWPDYSLETMDLYKTFTFANIAETGCFDIWVLKDGESEEEPSPSVQNVPSWAIDWSRPATESLQPGFRYEFRFDQMQACMTLQSQAPLARLTSRGILLVMGFELCQVLEVTNTVYTSFSSLSRVEWDPTSWEEHGHVLREWARFLSSMFGSEPAEYAVMLNYLWRIMVGEGLHCKPDGTILPQPIPKEAHLAILQSDDLFRAWWTSHLGTWPGYTPQYGGRRDLVERPDLAPLTPRCRIRAEDRRLCILSQGGLGLVPKQCRPQDRICLIRGSRWPVVLRPDDTASPEQPRSGTYRLIGPCLVYLPNFDWESCALRPLSEILIR